MKCSMFALLVVRAAALFGMFGKGTALNALKARRSVVKYSDKAVPASATTRALEAAIMAPNHFLSEPWRFYQCGAATLAKIAALNADKAAALPPNAMIVTLKSAHALDAKLGLEDHAAVACACQNFMLSLHADGVASKWMTGAMGIAPEKLVDVAGAPADEKLMGVLWFGYAAEPAKAAPKRKLGVDGVFTKLG